MCQVEDNNSVRDMNLCLGPCVNLKCSPPTTLSFKHWPDFEGGCEESSRSQIAMDWIAKMFSQGKYTHLVPEWLTRLIASDSHNNMTAAAYQQQVYQNFCFTVAGRFKQQC